MLKWFSVKDYERKAIYQRKMYCMEVFLELRCKYDLRAKVSESLIRPLMKIGKYQCEMENEQYYSNV
jgi:hypothetical protein